MKSSFESEIHYLESCNDSMIFRSDESCSVDNHAKICLNRADKISIKSLNIISLRQIYVLFEIQILIH